MCCVFIAPPPQTAEARRRSVREKACKPNVSWTAWLRRKAARFVRQNQQIRIRRTCPSGPGRLRVTLTGSGSGADSSAVNGTWERGMSLPQSMTFIAAEGAGGPEVLCPATAPIPQRKPDELLIRVLAAGVNRPDVQQRKGLYPPPPGASPILGLEVAGEVV